ncbi:GNAT family N-acetyltransferase [Endozoicomonas sp. SM1973]|uniref:GNAT family N-acetyltransferase n=1 Tax=Spartinivicinus marinus TaxID=2994442 RepID=A0A853I6W0_9GAMM|nr:GNAT family N-acetyltransferase [Spartinivicinus marinus]MCX4028474.1 GNAT family N-acetyltransferase [Spartinivicinus marinus]NYZ67412.1 GNAT family N-acetyltransferase [Spartinivicinus marinus]
MKSTIKSIKDKRQRHQERHTALGYQYVIADSIDFINVIHWDQVVANASVFMSRQYLQVIDANSPTNTEQRYALAYQDGKPVAAVVCQIATISGKQLVLPDKKLKEKVIKQYRERVLVCGNLVSNGLHGVALTSDLSAEQGWRIVAELIYRIRRGEKLNGSINFALVKDLGLTQLEASMVMERYSYRKIQTDPDMVLELPDNCTSFDDYLQLLTSKYRNRVKKIQKQLKQAEITDTQLTDLSTYEQVIHNLYLQVEQKAEIRPATLPRGYFSALATALGDHFACSIIEYQGDVVGFVSTIKDGKVAKGYYVGVDYQVNAEYPIYFRLLQLIIEHGISMGCNIISFGRTAVEPKTGLGAKPEATFVWARHRIPAVNFLVRKLFKAVPVEEAPERKVLKL